MFLGLSVLSLMLSYIHTHTHTHTDTDSNPLELLFKLPFVIWLLHLGKIAALQEEEAVANERDTKHSHVATFCKWALFRVIKENPIDQDS